MAALPLQIDSYDDSGAPNVDFMAIGDALVTEERSWVWSQSEHEVMSNHSLGLPTVTGYKPCKLDYRSTGPRIIKPDQYY